MSSDLIRQLKQLKHTEVSPRADWVKSNRELLLAQIKNTVSSSAPKTSAVNNVWTGLTIFLPKQMVFNVVRPMAILLIVTMVATSGWIATVDASYNTLPGDWLYPAKRAVEKTQVAAASLVGAKNTETKLHSEFAKRRAQEVKKIVQSNDPGKVVKVQQTIAEIKTEMINVNTNLDEIKNSTDSSANIAKDVKQNTDDVKDILKGVKDNLLTGTTTADKILSQEVSSAKDIAKDTSVKAVEVIVGKHLNGDNSVTVEEVKTEISKTLEGAASDAVESKKNVEGVKTVMEAVKTEVKELNQSQNPIVASTTKAMNEKIASVASDTKEATAKAEAINVIVDKNVSEARVLLDSGDLAQALSKVKDATEATKEAEKISDATLTAVQNVAPVAATSKEVVAPIVGAATVKDISVIVTTTPPATTNTPVVPVITVIVTSTKK